MKKVLSAVGLIGAMTAPHVAVAAERTVTFAVESMTCVPSLYIYIIKTSLTAVPGVTRVNVSFRAQTVTVTFDDAKATVGAIAAASAKAGLNARLKESQQESIKP